MSKYMHQILKNQKEILSYVLTQYDKESSFAEDVRVLIKETEDFLNPKEDVPYEDSLEVCANCGRVELAHPDIQGCREFVKSSINEKEKGQ